MAAVDRKMPPDSRRERKKRALKEHIYQHAVALFIEQGCEKTTIDQIAERADIGRATFFNHYASKEAILHEIAREATEFARQTFGREFRKPGPVSDKIRRSLVLFARIVENNPKYYGSVFLDVLRSQAGFTRAPDDLTDALAEHLEAEQTLGTLDRRLDATQLAEILTGVYMYTILTAIQRGRPYSLIERMENAVAILLHGCLPPPACAHPPRSRARKSRQ